MKVLAFPVGVKQVALRQRLIDYLELTKPRIAAMVLVTVAAGYLMAAGLEARLLPLLHTLIGTALVASGASAWNMYLERQSDAKMRRTSNRPLPAGRLTPVEVAIFGTALAITGINYLVHSLPSSAAAVVAGVTFVLYVAAYTPLKTVASWNTHVGAIPGALPGLIGWCAATGTIGWNGLVLFLVILFWQLPHFMAIAWMHREDYGRAGLKMIPVSDPTGRNTSRCMVSWCVMLIAASLLPMFLGRPDWIYGAGALFVGGYFLRSTLRFRFERSHQQARKVLLASIVYLPAMMGLLILHVFVTGCAREQTPPPGTVRAKDLEIPVPEFKLIERSGKTVTRDDLHGKVWVASFVFARCSGPCPQVSATMGRLQSELNLAEQENLRLVTFTIDPERDTPNELKDYANRFRADPEKWLFLTGKEEEIHKLVIEGFKAAVVRTKNTKPGEEFDHSTRLAVVDKQGNIRGYFDGLRSKSSTDPEADFEMNLRELKAAVKVLLKE